MKKTLLVFSILTFAALNVPAPTEYDLRKGVDLTAKTSVTGSQLNQLVDAGTVSATNKGIIIRRSGGGGSWWPDVTNNPRYTNFLWLDTYTSPSTLKSYVPTGDVYSNWVVASISPGSVGTAQLADSSVTSVKIVANAIQDTNIANNAVTSAKIASSSINSSHLQANSVLTTHIAPGNVLGDNIATNTVSTTNLADSSVTRPKIATDAVGTVNITNGAVTVDKLAPGTLNATVIETNSIYGTNIADRTITTTDIAANTLTTNNYALALRVLTPKHWGLINDSGTILDDSGTITSVTKIATGKYVVAFPGLGSSALYATFITVNVQAASTVAHFGQVLTNTPNSVTVGIYSASGPALADMGFSILIFDAY